MAHNEQDVLDLMNYTRGFKTLNPEQEYVTISMGKVGKISRLTADLTGSSWSYARVGDESAPGQIPLENMRLTDILGWQRSLPIPFVIVFLLSSII